jgi:DNA-binding NtrC family response regulator
MGGNILVIGPDEKNSPSFRRLLTRLPFTVASYDAIDHLPPELDIRRYRAVIIDLDDKTPSKTTFETWRRANNHLNILGISSKSFHPGLSEVIGQHLFACLKKPVDEDELFFLLNSMVESFEDDEAAT